MITAYRGDEDTKRHMKVMGDLGQIVPLVSVLLMTDRTKSVDKKRR